MTKKEIILTQEILRLMATNNCTVLEASDILKNVSTIVQSTATVQFDDEVEKIIKSAYEFLKQT